MAGQDLGWFFHQWLYDIKNYDVAIAQVEGNTITFENHREIKIPVDVRVQLQDGTTQDLVWDGRGQKTGTLTVADSSPIKKVVADPEQKLLDIDQTNNSWPRNVRLHLVPLYHPLYDIPIFEPEDSYNVVAGPEINQGIGLKASVQKPYDQMLYAGTDYDINEDQHHSRLGYQLNNIWQSQTSLSAEIRNTQDYHDHEDDLASGQLTLRRELWPAAYGITQANDHASLYLVRNQSVKTPYTQNTSYLRRDEAIVGTGLHLSRARPYWDPREGFTFDLFAENSGHFLGATQYFNRAGFGWAGYQKVTNRSKLAFRVKHGAGRPNDKNLFELGGMNGLRGFDRKTIRGSNMVLGSIEYRFPLLDNLDWKFFDNIMGIEGVSGVAFFDAGQSWYAHLRDSRLYKDAGVGLRLHVNIGSMLEKIIVRLDAAQAINETDDGTHYWFGINHAF